MDPKYFILILFFGYPNNTFFSNTETITTEKPQSTLLTSLLYVSANSQNTTGNTLGQPTQFGNISPGQLTSPAKTAGQSTPTISVSSRKPVAHTSAKPLAYNITRQPIPTANTSFPSKALPAFTSARELPSSAYTSTRQPSTPFVYPPSSQQSSSPVHTSSGKPVPPTFGNLSTWPISTVKNLPRNTPGFIFETTSNKEVIKKTDYRSTAAIFVGTVLTFMLVAIIMIVLWKCLRKPVLNDHNWAGRSPFADGETPDMCMDNIRENELSTKRTSIVSLKTWKPNKSTLLADDLEIKLFESSENIEDANNPKTEKIKYQVNDTSEISADGSTIGTAVSSSDDTDLPLPTPLLDLEGQDSSQSDKPTMIILSPLPNDFTNLQPSLEGLYQACEDPNSDTEQSFPLPPESFSLPPPQADFVKTQDSNEIQCREFSIPLDSDQDLNKSLPPPPAELL